MKRILWLLSALSFTTLISSYSMNLNVIANEKKVEEQKPVKKTTTTDHVCGMEVHKDKALKLEHDGKTYYFCSKNCEETFKKEPSKYLKKETKHKEEKEKETKGKTHND